MNYILAYYNLIKTGKIITSKRVMQQFEKIVYDLENPNEYHFDIDKATRPIKFIEKFCKHSKGKWAGKPVILDLWQKAIIQSVFGFVDKNGIRKYKEVFIIVARKNGKSTLLSAIGLYMLFADGEGGAQVCCVASKKDQAKIVFDEAKNMVSQSPLLKKHIRKRKSDLYVDLTFSTFEPLASDSNTLDGLNMHCGILDEIHAWKDRNIYDVSKQSMGTRTQPILFEISTAGFVRENIFDSQHQLAIDILDGKKEDDRFLSFLYELDDKNEWDKPDMWIKANPGLGTIKSLTYLKEQVERAKNDTNYMATLLTKEFNIRETASQCWLSFDELNNQETYNVEEFRDCYCIGGCDLSSTTDLTCATLMGFKESKLLVKQMYWIPENNLEHKIVEDKIPYDKWKALGWLRTSQGSKVEYTDVTKWFLEQVEQYELRPLWVGYDSWNAQYWSDEMVLNGFDMVEVRQGAKTMSTPMKQMKADLMDKVINYNNNPILKWCLSNVSVKFDDNENIRPVKLNQRARIDGAMSLIDAYVIYFDKKQEYTNFVKER